jgi:hypothetical protein
MRETGEMMRGVSDNVSQEWGGGMNEVCVPNPGDGGYSAMSVGSLQIGMARKVLKWGYKGRISNDLFCNEISR